MLTPNMIPLGNNPPPAGFNGLDLLSSKNYSADFTFKSQKPEKIERKFQRGFRGQLVSPQALLLPSPWIGVIYNVALTKTGISCQAESGPFIMSISSQLWYKYEREYL